MITKTGADWARLKGFMNSPFGRRAAQVDESALEQYADDILQDSINRIQANGGDYREATFLPDWLMATQSGGGFTTDAGNVFAIPETVLKDNSMLLPVAKKLSFLSPEAQQLVASKGTDAVNGYMQWYANRVSPFVKITNSKAERDYIKARLIQHESFEAAERKKNFTFGGDKSGFLYADPSRLKALGPRRWAQIAYNQGQFGLQPGLRGQHYTPGVLGQEEWAFINSKAPESLDNQFRKIRLATGELDALHQAAGINKVPYSKDITPEDIDAISNVLPDRVKKVRVGNPIYGPIKEVPIIDVIR